MYVSEIRRQNGFIIDWNTIIIWGEAVYEAVIVWSGIMLECSCGNVTPLPAGCVGGNRFVGFD
jgi:hypothetical protein